MMADDTVPSGTFGDYAPTNADAKTYDGKNSVCQRSGFKARPEDLVREWTGLLVLPKFKDFRNPQDAQRSISGDRSSSAHATTDQDQFIVISEAILDELGREIKDVKNGILFSENTPVTL